jgi:hypothetical protein
VKKGRVHRGLLARPGLGAARREIETTIFPGLPPEVSRNGDGLFFDPSERSYAGVVLYGHTEDFEFANLDVFPKSRFIAGSYQSWTAAAQGRLVAAGWQVSDAEVTGATFNDTGQIDDTGRTFTATRGGLALEVETTTDVVDTPAGSFDVNARVDRLTPAPVTAASVLGLLAGALIGWLVTGWVSRRTERAGPGVRTLTRLAAVIALVVLLPQAVAGLLLLATQAGSEPPGVPFWWLSVTYGYGCSFFGLGLFAITLVAATVARESADDPAAVL